MFPANAFKNYPMYTPVPSVFICRHEAMIAKICPYILSFLTLAGQRRVFTFFSPFFPPYFLNPFLDGDGNWPLITIASFLLLLTKT